jgi:glycosyltransferase involved in cell wall biosynthesis
MKIAIAVHGRYHAFDLARAIDESVDGAEVRQVATTYPRWAARRFLPAHIPLRTAPSLEAWRRFHGRTRIGPSPDVAISRTFGRFAARTLPEDCDVFVGWSSASLEAIRVARARGRLTVVERGSTHILNQQDVLDRVYASNGARFPGIPTEIIERELAEYEAADLIAVPTRFAAETFVARGVAPSRLLVNSYGVDAARFSCPDRPTRDRPTILFVGAVGFQKGAPDLLAAFSRLGGAATLELAGPVEPGWQPETPPGVWFLGALDRDGVIAALARADIFCLPSHQEGLSLSLLQAMAAGLPVVATSESGAAEVISEGVEGRLVEAGNPEALAAALAGLAADAGLRAEMGRCAAERAAAQTWSAYGNRAVRGYKDTLGATAA